MSENNSDMSLLKNILDKEEKEEDGGVWNIFVQILLPLVLILTFVAVVDIMKYKDIAKGEKESARQAWEKYYDEVKNNNQLEQKNSALIGLQLQKLMVALEKVKKEESQKLKLNIFPDAGRIKLQDIDVVDDDFKELCTASDKIFKSDAAEQEKKDAIYFAVIKKAEDIKDSESEKRIPARLPLVTRHHKIPKDEPYIIDTTEITTANRMKIHNEIIAFVSDLKVMACDLQTGLLHRIFEYLLENPETLDENLKQLADTMNLENNMKIKKELVKRFHMLLIECLQRKIEEMGLKFHRDTWNNLKVLEINQ